MCGSLRYLSPEQARGDDDAIDHRTDVFGLGGLLLFVLTGWAPYEGDPEEVRRRAAHARLDQAFELLEMSPASAPVQAVVRRAMACDPAWRYRDAGRFRGALETALGAAPDRRPWWRWPRRREAHAAPACGSGRDAGGPRGRRHGPDARADACYTRPGVGPACAPRWRRGSST